MTITATNLRSTWEVLDELRQHFPANSPDWSILADTQTILESEARLHGEDPDKWRTKGTHDA